MIKKVDVKVCEINAYFSYFNIVVFFVITNKEFVKFHVLHHDYVLKCISYNIFVLRCDKLHSR